MQTEYNVNYGIGREGLTQGDRKARPFQLPQLPQISTETILAGALTADHVLTVVDDETGQTYTLASTGSATEATLMASILADFAVSDKLRDLFTISASIPAADIEVALTAKHANRSYTISGAGGPNAAAPTVALTQGPGGAGLEFGRLVARATSGDDHMRALAAGDAITDVAGALVWSESAAFRNTDAASNTFAAADLAARGKTYPICEQCRAQFRVEQAVTPASTPFVRINAAGRLGGLRADADGGDAIDASSIVTFESSAAADQLVWVKVHLGAQ